MSAWTHENHSHRAYRFSALAAIGGRPTLALLLVVCATSWATPFTVPLTADHLDITGLPEGWIDESGRATVDRVADAGNPHP